MGTVNHSALATAADLHTARPRNNNGDPTGSVTPNWSGELLWDATNGRFYVSTGTGVNDWAAIVVPAAELEPVVSTPSVVEDGFDNTVQTTGVVWSNVAGYEMQVSSPPTTYNLTAGQEASGSANNSTWVQYAAIEADQDTGEDPITFRWLVGLPAQFNDWNEAGILVYHKVERVSGTTEALTLTLEALDPATGAAFGTAKTATRSFTTVSDDTAYQKVRLTGTDLGAGYSAANLVELVLTLEKDAFSGTPDTVKLYVAQLVLFWTDQ